MNQYNPDARCPKCECTGIGNKFYKKGAFKHYEGGFYESKLDGRQWHLPHDTIVEQDHIERKCFNCDYTWDEMPLDSEDGIYNPGESPDASAYEIIEVDSKGNILSRKPKEDTV